MPIVTVTTQAELDAALAAATSRTEIVIRSEPGVWLQLTAYDSAKVEAYGSATVEASGSATVEASGSATVRAYGSATVRASGSATVRAYGSATVEASDSATVEASDSATVRASKFVAVHLHQHTVTVEGGVVIDCTALHETSDAAAWVEVHGAEADPDGATAVVYKAVNAQLRSQHGFTYTPGQTVVAPDWRQADECGFGLHFGATPHHADAYYGLPDVRFLACRITLAEAIGITGRWDTPKIKARSCVVLHEVDRAGRPVAAEAVQS